MQDCPQRYSWSSTDSCCAHDEREKSSGCYSSTCHQIPESKYGDALRHWCLAKLPRLHWYFIIFLDEHIFSPRWLTSSMTRPSPVTVKKHKTTPPTPCPTTQRMMSRSDLPHCLWQIFQPLSFSLWRHSDLEDKTLMLAVIPHNSFQIGEADWMTIQWLTENDFTNTTNWWMLSKVDTVFILWYCAHCYALWCV